MVFVVDEHRLPPPCVAFAQAPQALVRDEGVRFYFSTRSIDSSGKALSHIAYADLDGDFRVVHVGEPPVLGPGALGCYDEHGVFPLNVLRDGERVLGYVGGWSRRVSVQVDGAVGLAVSRDDGLSFERFADGPVLAASPSQPFLVGDPFVMKEGATFHMWHIFGTRWLRLPGCAEPERVYKIGHATSADGVTWESHAGRAVADVLGDDECQALPTVARVGGSFHMLFCFREAAGFRRDRRRAYRLGHAVSDDLDTWIRDDASSGLSLGLGGWDSEMMCYPHLFSFRGDVYVAYNGNDFGRAGFGLARLAEA